MKRRKALQEGEKKAQADGCVPDIFASSTQGLSIFDPSRLCHSLVILQTHAEPRIATDLGRSCRDLKGPSNPASTSLHISAMAVLSATASLLFGERSNDDTDSPQPDPFWQSTPRSTPGLSSLMAAVQQVSVM